MTPKRTSRANRTADEARRLHELAALIKRTREELGLSHDEAAERTKDGGRREGISRGSWIQAEKGEVNPRALTRRGIEFVCGWEQNSIDWFLEGGEVTPRLQITQLPAPDPKTKVLLATFEQLDELTLRQIQRAVDQEIRSRTVPQQDRRVRHFG